MATTRIERLHRAGLRLALALALAMLAGSAYLAAPVIFAAAPSRELAGGIAAAVFARAYPLAGLFLLAAAAFGWRAGERARGFWIGWGAALALVAVLGALLAPEIDRLRTALAAAGGLDALAADHPLRRRFGLMHGVASTLHLIATLLAAWLVARRG